jgi:hypothetical protein
MSAWRARMDTLYTAHKDDSAYSTLAPTYRRLYPDPANRVHDEQAREEAALCAQRAGRVDEWAHRHLAPRASFSCKRIGVDPSMLTRTGDALYDALANAGCRSWPVVRQIQCPPEEEAQHGNGNLSTASSSKTVLPKILVTWFVLDDGQSSLFRFSVYDPNASLMETYNLASRPPPAPNRFGESKDPLRHLRHLGRDHIANNLDESVLEKMYAFLMPPARFGGAHALFDSDPSSSSHISQALTLKRALSILGCTQVDVSAFERIPAGVAARKLELPPAVKAYVLHPRMCFWYSPQYLGIGFTHWPGSSAKHLDFAAAIVSGAVKIQEGKVVENVPPPAPAAGGGGAYLSLSEYAASGQVAVVSPLVDKRELIASKTALLHYETGDQMVIWQAEAEAAVRKIRQLLPENPAEKPDEYATYCGAYRRLQVGQLQKFCSIWVLDSTVDSRPISGGLKAVIKHLGDVVRKSPDGSVTSRMPYLDEGMTLFGNMSILRMMLLSKVARIINTKIPFTAGALLSTFDKRRDGEPKLHISLSGPAAVGKTYPLHFFIKKCFILGTYEVFFIVEKSP